jgi:hypothetical protein
MDFGFCGGAYQNRALTADNQKCMNLYPEVLAKESPRAKAPIIMHATPGLVARWTDLEGPIRAMFTESHLFPSTDRVFAVGGSKLYELFFNPITLAYTQTDRGTIPNDNNPAFMASNGTQLAIASFNELFIYDLTTNVLTGPISGVIASSVRFIDGYFVANVPGTQDFYISDLNDGTSWNQLDFAAAEGAPDNIVAILARPNDLLLFGDRTIQPFINTGDALFPFEPVQGGWLKIGCIAPASVSELHGVPFWLGQSEEGPGIAYAMLSGYQASRISTHAIESHWATFSTMQDAIGWTYVDGGHSFYVLLFQDADETWVYDMATDLWHERGCWDSVKGQFNAHRGRVHAFGFNKHLVGSR